MKILLRENDGKIWALDPETRFNLTTIPVPSAWCWRNIEHDNPRGAIYWNSWGKARSELRLHDVITDDTILDEIPIINRASFDPADMLAENMTIRQAYKMAAFPALISKWSEFDNDDLATAAGQIADAMIAEDKRHSAAFSAEAEGK